MREAHFQHSEQSRYSKGTKLPVTQSQRMENNMDERIESLKTQNLVNKINPKFGFEIELGDSKDHKAEEQLKQNQTVAQQMNGSFIVSENETSKNEKDSANHRTISYRPDIDGIRAIAILLVLIYHAFPSKLPGGFIGVDVFFVISGFLITQIIVKQILTNKFSILNFYCRRIKRIYPALILVLCLVLWIVGKFTQIDLINFSLDTLNSALIFCANINILYHKKDYFDADIRGNPLLHLWSLGVEEQFYIIWPFLLVLTLKFFRNSAMNILCIFTVCSFMFSIACVYMNAKFAFYFPLCRFWQMSIGGILGYAEFRFRSQKINNILSVVGLMAILITSFLVNDESLFPGFWTLLPTLGCAFIIQTKNQSFINKHILSSKPFTFIGKISYSLYLWHWPLIAGSRILYPHGSKSIFSNIRFIVVLAFGLSILTYFIAERPVRKIKGQKIVIVLLLLMGCIGVSSIYLGEQLKEKYYSMEGVELFEFFNKVNRQMAPEEQDYVTINGKKHPNFSVNKKRQLPKDIDQVRAQIIQLQFQEAHPGMLLLEKSAHESQFYKDIYNTLGNGWLYEFSVANEGQDNQLLLIGDSHMQKISYRFQELFRRSQIKGTLDTFPTVMVVVKRGMIMGEENPTLNFTRALVQKRKPQRILFAWNWIVYLCNGTFTPIDSPATCDQKSTKKHIAEFINFIHELQNQGIQVYTVGIHINYIQYRPENMFDANGLIQENLKPFKYSQLRKKYQFMYDYVQGELTKAKIKWIDTATNLCWDDLCHVISPKGYAANIDIDHMGKFMASNWFTIYDHLVQF